MSPEPDTNTGGQQGQTPPEPPKPYVPPNTLTSPGITTRDIDIGVPPGLEGDAELMSIINDIKNATDPEVYNQLVLLKQQRINNISSKMALTPGSPNYGNIADTPANRAAVEQHEKDVALAHKDTVELGKGGMSAFNYAKQRGLIPANATYVPGETEKKWGYISQEQLQNLINQLVSVGAIKDGDQLRGLTSDPSKTYQNLLDVQRVWQKSYDFAVSQIAPFKEGDNYNLSAALAGGVSANQLKTIGFSQADIDEAKKINEENARIDAENKAQQAEQERLDKLLQPYKVGENQYDLQAAAKSVSKADLIAAGFNEKDVNEALTTPTTAELPTEGTTTQRYENEAELRAYGQELAKSNPELFKTFKSSFESGNWGAYNQAVQSFNDNLAKQDADFKNNNIELPDGQWIAKTDLAQAKQADPKLYNILTTKGLSEANNYVKTQNLISNISLNQNLKAINANTSVKDIYRILTPWSEEKGENVLTYAKGWPGRVVSTVKNLANPPPSLTQKELKTIYDNQQAAKDTLTQKNVPLWAKAVILASNENTVTYNPKNGQYHIIASGVGPPVGGKFTPKITTAERVNWSPIVKALETGVERSTENAKQWQTVTQSIQAGLTREASMPKYNPEVVRRLQASAQTWQEIQNAMVGRSTRIGIVKQEQAATQREIQQLTDALYKSNPRQFVILGSINPEVYLSLKQQGLVPAKYIPPKAQINAIKNLAVISKIDTLPVEHPLITNTPGTVSKILVTKSPKAYEPGYREKVYAKPDIKETTATQLEDVRSTRISLPKEQQLPSPKQVSKTSTMIKPAVKTTADTSVTRKSPTKQAGRTIVIQPKITPSGKSAERVRPETSPQIKPISKTKTVTQTITARQLTGKKETPKSSRTRPQQKPKIPTVKLPSFKNLTDEEKRDAIKQAGGAFYWQQGQLHGKKVYHVGVVTGGKVIPTTVLGKPPEGAIRTAGAGQAKRTIRVIRGSAPERPVKLEGGAVDVVVSPTKTQRQVSIDFVRDPRYRGTKMKMPSFTSRKHGKIIETRIGGRTVLSRRSLRRRK